MRQFKTDEPSDNAINEEPEILWVTLPNGEPGAVLTFVDMFGESTKDLEEAEYIIAADRYKRFWQFEIQSDTLKQPRMQ